MNFRGIKTVVVASILVIGFLSSCHRSTCPTFGKETVRQEVRV